jgi:type I restriction enzyme S subunit
MDFIIDNFDMLFDSEDNLKKLEEIILDLAVRGKLVPQDPTDEPASVLIGKIEEEKKRLIADKKIKKPSKLEPIEEEEIPFELPNSWEWVRFGDLISITSGKNLTKNKMAKDGVIPVYGGNGITGYHNEFNVDKETLVIGRVGFYCGSIHLTKQKAWVTDNAFISTFDEKNIYIRWLKWILKATNLSINDNATAQPVISGRKINPILIALPPLAEQKRIVDKIDSVKALIEKLRSQVQNREKTREALKKSIMIEIEKSSDDGELLKNLEMIFQNFDIVVKKKEDIKDIRDLILSMAVNGKLVPQDPKDEPASVLVEKIEKEKARLVIEKKIKKPKKLEPIKEEEIPFELPVSWEWVRLGEITDYGQNKSIKPNQINENMWTLELEDIEKESSKILKRVYNSERNVKSNKNFFKAGDVLYGKLRPYLKKVVVVENDGVCTTEIIPFNGFCGVSSTYLMHYMKSNHIDKFVNEITHGMNMPRLGTDKARKLLISLPPLAEQKKIVDRIDSLMKLCDRLETQVEKSQREMDILMESVTQRENKQ